MIIYNTTFHVEATDAKNFVIYLHEVYIPSAEKSGILRSPERKNDQADKDEFHPYRTPGRHAADGLSDHADAAGLQPDDQREQGRSDGVESETGAGTGAVPRDHQPPLRRAGTAEQ